MKRGGEEKKKKSERERKKNVDGKRRKKKRRAVQVKVQIKIRNQNDRAINTPAVVALVQRRANHPNQNHTNLLSHPKTKLKWNPIPMSTTNATEYSR